MKKRTLALIKIVFSIATIPLWFVKMFVGIGHLPDRDTGEIVEVIFRHTMLENIGDLIHPILAYVAMTLACISALMNAIVLKFPDNKAMKLTANVFFGIAIGIFLILLLMASTVSRGY